MKRMSHMKLLRMQILTAIALSIVCACAASAAHAAQEDGGHTDKGRPVVDQTVAAESNVTVMLCVESGNITVRGWDRKEVHARSTDSERIELRRVDAPGATGAATRLEVLLVDSEDEHVRSGECNSTSDIVLDVPRGAYLLIKGDSGDIDVSGVAGVHVDTVSGDVEVRSISKVAEVMSANGDISLKNSSGRVRLGTISGEVEAINVNANEASDDLLIKSTTGDITLEQIGHTHVAAATVSSSIRLTGALAHGGFYDLRSTTGDVTLTLPTDSSFQLNAKVYQGGEIITDFPIRTVNSATPFKNLNLSRLIGSYGKGDATLNLSSFSGIVQLKKK